MKKRVGAAAELIDGKGNFMMPGFIDSHIHGISGGRGLTKANTSDKLLSIEELAAYAKDVLKKKKA
ncbi:MAG: amidohydrolase family protein [Bacteroidota bacterium]